MIIIWGSIIMSNRQKDVYPNNYVSDTQLTEQLDYYRKRASEYDDWWYRRGEFNLGDKGNATWFEEVNVIKKEFVNNNFHGDFLELAAGTGTWSSFFLEYAKTLTLVDGSEEMLSKNFVAKEPNVQTIIADLFKWIPDQKYDSIVFTFWISHIPRERLTDFFNTVSSGLKTGGKIFFVDDRKTSGVSESHVVKSSNQTMIRKLGNGENATIVKNFFSDNELEQIGADVGLEMSVDYTSNYFQYGIGTKKDLN